MARAPRPPSSRAREGGEEGLPAAPPKTRPPRPPSSRARDGGDEGRAPPEAPASDSGAAADWAAALAGWAIPEHILASAPESPWLLPPALFRADERAPDPTSPSRLAALDALGAGGTVLDIGCGGGGAGLALVPPATRVVGVDASVAMLTAFAAAAGERRVDHAEVEGSWPEVADRVEAADVVVCHHVVYNVPGIAAFVTALTSHAHRAVVVELTERHPTADLSPPWQRFWGPERPERPTAEDFVAVVRQTGARPEVTSRPRPAAPHRADDPTHVAFVRRRLCLPASADAEVAAALTERTPPSPLVTVTWRPDT